MQDNATINNKFQYIKKQFFVSILFVLVVLSLFFLSNAINNVSALSDVEVIDLPDGPRDMVFNMVDLKIYVRHGSSISIIDGITNTLLQTGNMGFSVNAITDGGSFGIFMTGISNINGTLTPSLYSYNGVRVDFKTPLPARSNSLAYDPINKEIYVNIPSLNKVVVIDIVNWQIIAEIPINQNNAKKIIFNPIDNNMYLIHDQSSFATVSLIYTQTKLVKTIDTRVNPRDIAPNPVNRNIYVLSDNQKFVSLIDIYKEEVKGNVYIGNAEDAYLTFNPIDNKMYVFGPKFISVIDSITNTVSNIIPFEFAPPERNPIVNPINNKMYIGVEEPSDQIIVKQFNTIPSNAICPSENFQNLTKIIFRIVDGQIASSLSLPVRSELDITLLDPHINKVSDIKKMIGDYLGRPNIPRNAIEITDIEYSIMCTNMRS